jgi:hypothetical protein
MIPGSEWVLIVASLGNESCQGLAHSDDKHDHRKANRVHRLLEHFRNIVHKTVLTPGPLLLSLFAVLLLIQA